MFHRFNLVIAVVLLFLLCTEALQAFRWPEFRGPTGQGHATGTPPIHWDAQKNVVWKQAIPGSGWSSPVVGSDRVFLSTAITEQNTSSVSLRGLCLDANDGTVRWNVEVFHPANNVPRIHTKNSHASPTPLIDENRVFMHFGHHGTACLDLDGRIIWRNNELAYSPVHGSGGSPIIVGDLLVFSCDGASDPLMVALEKSTGKIRWKVPRKTDATKTFSFSTPLLINVDGTQQIVSPGSNVVCAYDAKDGREIWRVRYDGYSVIPRPVFGHGLIFIGTGYDRPTVMAIRPDGKGDVTDSHVVWILKRSAPNTPSLLLIGNELYLVSDGGIASCLDARTGAIHWQERLGGNYSASPIHADGRIYFQSEEGTGTVVEASTAFKVLSVNALNERSLASYAVAGNTLFIRTAQHLYRIEQR